MNSQVIMHPSPGPSLERLLRWEEHGQRKPVQLEVTAINGMLGSQSQDHGPQSLAGETLKPKEVPWPDHGHGGTPVLIECTPVSLAVRFNRRHGQEDAWHRPGACCSPVPLPPHLPAALAEGHRYAVPAGCLPPTAPLSKQSTACPELALAPARLQGVDSTALHGHGAEQAGPAPRGESDLRLPASGVVCWYVTMGICRSEWGQTRGNETHICSFLNVFICSLVYSFSYAFI